MASFVKKDWVDAAGGFPDPLSASSFYDAMNALSQAVKAVNPSYTAPTWAPPTSGTAIVADDLDRLEAGVAQAIADAAAALAAGAGSGIPSLTIATNTNWNTLTTGGWYVFNSGGQGWTGQGQVNAPDQAYPYGLLEVSLSGTAILQRYTSHTGGGIWSRQRFDGGWSSWQLVPAVGPGRNAITGWFHVDGYGAKGDGTTDDTAAIQAAVDAANVAYATAGGIQRVYFPPKTHLVSAVPMLQSNGSQDGVCSIHLRSGVELYGDGARVKVKNSAYGNGAYYGIVRSDYEGLIDAGITGVQFDGNSPNQVSSNNAGNILLEARRNVWVRDVLSVQANGNSIMVRGNAYGDPATEVRIYDCVVYGARGVGIQASQFDGLQILRNTVRDTTDNCIDVYGEYGNYTTTSHGTNFQVSDNSCRGGLVGLFVETVAYGVVAGNRVSNCGTGVRVNRINGQPTSISIKDNGFFGCTIGAAFSGVMDAVSFVGNEVQGATDACVKFDGLQCAGVFGSDNLLNGSNTSVPLILVTNYVTSISQCYFVRTMTKSSQSPSFVNYAQSGANCTFAAANGPGF